MVERIFRLLLCVVFLASGYDCHQWSSHLTAGTVKYTCVGSTAMLPWTVAMENGEIIHDVMWQYQTPSGPQTVAYYAGGIFMPGPGYAGRVSYVPNAGIMLTGLSKNDTGNYTVEVTGRNGSQMWSLNQDGFLQVLDNTVVVGNGLQVVQQPKAVYDNATGEWMVDVTCGDFPFPTQPPFDVQWTSHSGTTKPSSHYENGKFHLHLTSQESSGQYTCEVSTQALCSGSSNSTGPVASATINEKAAALAILEAEFKGGSSATEIALLTQQNVGLKITNSTLSQQNAFLHAVNDQLLKTRDLLLQEKSNLTQKLLTLEGKLEGLRNASVPESCLGLNRRLTLLDIYLNQSALKLTKELEASNLTCQDQSNLTCQEAKASLQKTAVELVLHNPATSLSSLRQAVQTILNNNNQTEDRSQISFDAKDFQLADVVPRGDVIVLDEASLNQGNGYDTGTGCFTAPVSGQYFLMGRVELRPQQALMTFHLQLGSHHHYRSAAIGGHQAHISTVQVVTHLGKGRKACLKADEDARLRSAAFSGFLLKQDHTH